MTDRWTGSVGTTVDLKSIVPTNRQTGLVGTMLDLVIVTSSTYPVTGTATTRQTVRLDLLTCTSRLYSNLETLTYTGLEALTYAQLEQICTPSSLPGSVIVATSQTTALRLTAMRPLTRTITQAQSVTRVIDRIYQRVLTAVQGQSVVPSRIYTLALSIPKNRAPTTQVSLLRQFSRATLARAATQPRMVRQISLTRAVSQSTSAHIAGLPVKLSAATAVQSRSLALSRAISLIRTIQQVTAAVVPRVSQLAPSVTVSNVLDCRQAVSLTRATSQATAVSIQASNVTPRYFITLSLTQGQAMSLQTASTGAPAKVFQVCPSRTIIFPMCQRAAHFQAPRRAVRFTVEVR